MESPGFLFELTVYLVAAVIMVPISLRLGLGSVIGYLAAGVAIGPWGLGIIKDVDAILHFSELGVVLLLFIIGLELQPSRLWVMRKAVFGLGAAQVVATGLVLIVFTLSLGLPFKAALVAGLALSLSSTAFVMQILEEKGQLNTHYGQASFAILLFQDLAAIPLLAVLPLLGHSEIGPMDGVALSVAKAIGAILIVVVGGRYLLRPVLRLIATAQLKEIFTGASLLLILGVAQLMSAIGLSMALGAFLAGVLLADSEYRHEIEADVDPFKGLLMGLFFIAVGMSVDLGLILGKPLEIILLALGLMLIKAGCVFILGRISGLNADSSRSLAVALPQGGEFAFVLFAGATAVGLLDSETSKTLVAVVTLSMALTPIFFLINERVQAREKNKVQPFDAMPDEANPVIIAGFGRVGQIVGRVVRLQGFNFTALELDPEQVDVVRRFGNKIFYGDASRLDLLEQAGTAKAKLFVIAIDDPETSYRVAEIVKTNFPNVKILARVRNRRHAFEIMDLGIDSVYRETLHSSALMARDALSALGANPETAARLVARFLDYDEKMLREQHAVYKDEEQLIAFSKHSASQLEQVLKADL